MLGIAVWLASCTVQAQVLPPFADVPANAWYFDAVKRARRGGLFVSSYDDTDFVHPNNRYSRAIDLHFCLSYHRGIAEAAAQGKACPGDLGRLMRGRSMFPFYDRALSEFGPELRELKVTDDAGFGRIKAISAELARTLPPQCFPFPDVPVGHWASQSVGDLRALGLFSGYPDSKFRG